MGSLQAEKIEEKKQINLIRPIAYWWAAVTWQKGLS